MKEEEEDGKMVVSCAIYAKMQFIPPKYEKERN